MSFHLPGECLKETSLIRWFSPAQQCNCLVFPGLILALPINDWLNLFKTSCYLLCSLDGVDLTCLFSDCFIPVLVTELWHKLCVEEGMLHGDLEISTNTTAQLWEGLVCHLDLQVHGFLKPVLPSAGYLLIQASAECSSSHVCGLESNFSQGILLTFPEVTNWKHSKLLAYHVQGVLLPVVILKLHSE